VLSYDNGEQFYATLPPDFCLEPKGRQIYWSSDALHILVLSRSGSILIITRECSSRGLIPSSAMGKSPIRNIVILNNRTANHECIDMHLINSSGDIVTTRCTLNDTTQNSGIELEVRSLFYELDCLSYNKN
jgi:hypothetical protein